MHFYSMSEDHQHEPVTERSIMPPVSTNGVIYFYDRKDPYFEFTNFAVFIIRLDDQWWQSTEHYFHAQKFLPYDTPTAREIQQAKTPRAALEKARRSKAFIRNNWHSIKVGVMYKAVMAKFSQHYELAQLLLATGTARLVERTDIDDFWGDGPDGQGRNQLGRTLMRVRDELSRAEA